jgi:serine/threonine protein kinase
MNIATKLTKLSKGYAVRNINKKLPIKIGYGAFGVVYLNKDKKNNLYALKKNEFALDIKHLHIACNEISMLSKFNNKRIPKLYKYRIDINENNTFDYCIYMEYFNGYDLYDNIIKKNIYIDIFHIFKYIKDISETLNYIHNFGYVYCDLKMENIIITDDGAKIVDFGQIQCKNKIGNTPLGTISYTPIECINSYNNYSEKSDYWCLGIILMLFVYNIHPFYSESKYVNENFIKIKNSQNIINNIFKNKSPKIVLNDNLLKKIQELILNLNNPDINKRYGYNELKNDDIWYKIFNKSYDNDII